MFSPGFHCRFRSLYNTGRKGGNAILGHDHQAAGALLTVNRSYFRPDQLKMKD